MPLQPGSRTASRCRLLVAVTQMGYMHARRALQGNFELVPAFNLQQAIASLEQRNIDAILCSVHFDESRMFELMDAAKDIAPGTPFVCCIMLASRLSQSSLAAMFATARSAGACGCIDYSSLQKGLGFSEADEKFRDELLRMLEQDCGLAKAAQG